MRIFLRNTETNENFLLTYLSLDLSWNSGENRYVSADIPQAGINGQPQYWQNGSNPQRQIGCVLDGTDALERLKKLQHWIQPIAKKNAPAICVLQVGALEPEWCVLTKVDATMPLTRFRGEKPTRIQVEIGYQVVPEVAIA
jgi:hypothetical protein